MQVVFSAAERLSKMVCEVNNPCTMPSCVVKHASMFVDCATGVVYRIPLPCKKCYAGQTGRCLNIRLREHHAAVNAHMGAGHLVYHCRTCMGCTPDFCHTRIMYKSRSQTAREIADSFLIDSEGARCVCAPSLALSAKNAIFWGGEGGCAWAMDELLYTGVGLIYAM